MDDGTMETAVLRIGCKVNLTLRITGVRPNGWHELDTVFLPLDEPTGHAQACPEAGRRAGAPLRGTGH